MATTAEHVAARRDTDLFDRFVAAAAQGGVKNPVLWVRENIDALLTAPVSGNSTIAGVHGYASLNYKQELAAMPAAPLPPGVNPAAVIDEFLAAAVAHVIE